MSNSKGKIIGVLVLAIALTGCASATYERDEDGRIYKARTTGFIDSGYKRNADGSEEMHADSKWNVFEGLINLFKGSAV